MGAAEPTSWIAAAARRGSVKLFIAVWMSELQCFLKERVLIDAVYISLTRPCVHSNTVTLPSMRMEPFVEADALPD